MLTKAQLQATWDRFTEQMAELRKKRQAVLKAHDKRKTQQALLETYQKIIDLPDS